MGLTLLFFLRQISHAARTDLFLGRRFANCMGVLGASDGAESSGRRPRAPGSRLLGSSAMVIEMVLSVMHGISGEATWEPSHTHRCAVGRKKEESWNETPKSKLALDAFCRPLAPSRSAQGARGAT